MKIHKSGEDYLEAILMIQKQKGMVRSIDLAHHMGYSKPSISHAVGVLKKGDYLTVDQDGYLHLTDSGKKVAENIYEKHRFFTSYLIEIGVDPTQAEVDACKMEHAVSDESFQKMKAALQNKDKN